MSLLHARRRVGMSAIAKKPKKPSMHARGRHGSPLAHIAKVDAWHHKDQGQGQH